MKNSEQSRYERAKKKVEAMKGFYRHLKAFIIINLILFMLKANVMSFFKGEGFNDLEFERWLDWNVYLTPILWGIALTLHGIYVFQDKFTFLKKWEERKIKEYMDQEDNLDLNL